MLPVFMQRARGSGAADMRRVLIVSALVFIRVHLRSSVNVLGVAPPHPVVKYLICDLSAPGGESAATTR
jgi:hypothetical protein